MGTIQPSRLGKTLMLVSASATLHIAASTSYSGRVVTRPSVIQGEQQSAILCEQIIKWQLVLNENKCVFPIFFSLQSYNVHQAIPSLE